jgi:hypothetical protein
MCGSSCDSHGIGDGHAPVPMHSYLAVPDDQDPPKVTIVTKRSEFTMQPPKGYLGFDEIRLRKCVSCDQNWADYPSPYCPACEAYQEHQR